MRTAMDMLNQFTRESSGEDAAAAVSNGDVPKEQTPATPLAEVTADKEIDEISGLTGSMTEAVSDYESGATQVDEIVTKIADDKTPVTAIDVLNYAGKLRIQQEKYGMSIISHEEIANDVNEAQSSPDKESKLKATLKKVGTGFIEFLKKLMEMVNAAATKAGNMINEFIKNRITQTALNKKTLAELVAKVESLPDQDAAGEFQDNVKTLLGGRLLSLSAVASIHNVPGSEDNVKVLLEAIQRNAEIPSKTNEGIIMISGKVIADALVEHTTPASICEAVISIHGVLRTEQLNNKYLKGVYDLEKTAGFATDAKHAATLVTGDKGGVNIRMLMAVESSGTAGKYVVNKKVSHFLNDSGLTTKVSPLKKADMVTLAKAMQDNVDKTIEFMNKLSAQAKQLSSVTTNLDKKVKPEMSPEQTAKFQEIAGIVQGLLLAGIDISTAGCASALQAYELTRRYIVESIKVIENNGKKGDAEKQDTTTAAKTEA